MVNEETNAKVPFILVTELPRLEVTTPQNIKRDKEKPQSSTTETPAKPAVQTIDQATQTTLKIAPVSSTNQIVPSVPLNPRSVSPTSSRPRSISPRSTASPSSPRKNHNLSIVTPTTPGARVPTQTSPRNVTTPRPSSSASTSSTTSTSTSTSASASASTLTTAPTPTPTPTLAPAVPSVNEATNILNVEQMLDYVDTLHDYIGDLEKEKRARGEFVPNVVRSASLPSAFKQRATSAGRPPLTNSLARNHFIPRSAFSTSQNVPPTQPSSASTLPVRSNTMDNLPAYILPSANPSFLLPTPIPSPRGDLPLTASQDSSTTPSYFTRSSYTTPNGTPLATSRSISSDIPYFTLSSFSSLDSIPESLLHSRFLNQSTTIPQTPENNSDNPYASTPAVTPSTSGLDPRVLRLEIHELQTQIYFRQAQLAAFLHIKFRITALPSKERRFSLEPNKEPRDTNRERNNLLAKFYSTLELPEPNVRMLYNEVAHRLEVPVDSILALVKNGDTLVTVDEDVEDGLTVDVYLDEQV